LKAAFVCSLLAIGLIVPAHLLSWYAIFIGDGGFHLQPSIPAITANGTLIALTWQQMNIHELSNGNTQGSFASSLFDVTNKSYVYAQQNLTNVESSFTTSLYTLVAAGALTAAMIPMLFCICCEACCECCQRSQPHHVKTKIAISVMALIAFGGIVASVATFTKLPTSFADDNFCGNRLVVVEGNGTGTYTFDFEVNPTSIIARGNQSYWCGSILSYQLLANITKQVSVAWSPLPGYWCAAAAAVPVAAVLLFTIASFLCCGPNETL